MKAPEPFGPWADAMQAAGIANPRNGRLSWRQLALRAGTTTSTITNIVTHRHQAKIETIQGLAVALRVSPQEISDWIGKAESYIGRPYNPVPEAALLTQDERWALDTLIRSITKGRV